MNSALIFGLFVKWSRVFLSLMQSPVCGADTCAVERVGVVEVVAGGSGHLKCEACARECEFVVNLPCCVPAQPCCCERERDLATVGSRLCVDGNRNNSCISCSGKYCSFVKPWPSLWWWLP